jgi:hypothetical protein
MRKEVVVSCLKIISQNLRAGTDENDEKPQDSQPPEFEKEGPTFLTRHADCFTENEKIKYGLRFELRASVIAQY